IGSLVETKSATIARSTSKRRSSALAIRIHLSNLTHFTVITSRDRCSHPHPPAVPPRSVAPQLSAAPTWRPNRPDPCRGTHLRAPPRAVRARMVAPPANGALLLAPSR